MAKSIMDNEIEFAGRRKKSCEKSGNDTNQAKQ